MGVTNGNINIYQPRTMAAPVDRRMPVTTFIRDTFFPEVQTYPTEQVDMDFRKGDLTIAPFVAQNVGGINMGRKGHQTKTYTPPRVAPQRPLSKEVLSPRLPGETVHTTMTPEERQDYYMQQDAQELDDAITRREEIMCSQLITNGIISVRGYIDDKLTNYIDDDIDYQFSQKTTLSGTSAWDQSGSKKYEDLEASADKVRQAGYDPRYAILGQDAYSLLRKDTDFQKLLDVRRFELGLISPEFRTQNGNGLKYIGNLPDLGLDLFVYYAWYKDYDGVIKPIFPKDHVVIAPGDLGEMMYGAITQLEEDKKYHTYEGSRVPKIIADTDNDVMTYRLSSRPMPKPYDVESWASLKVK